MATHPGTHVDAPRHLSKEGKPLEELDLNRFMGEGVVLDLSFKEIGSGIGADDLKKFSDLVRFEDIVILYTGCSNYLGESWINSKYAIWGKSGKQTEKMVETIEKTAGHNNPLSFGGRYENMEMQTFKT